MDFRTIGPDGSVTSWWKVEPLYDYKEDCQTGREYADQFCRAVVDGEAQTALLHIVEAFPYKKTGIEIGFMQRLTERII